MSDFITMTCPKCGGNLIISAMGSTLVCQHCGNEFLLHQEETKASSESFARCPQCQRNDRVQKVNAILASQSGTPLAEKLSPPDKPSPPTKPAPPLAGGAAGAVIFAFIFGLAGLWTYSQGNGSDLASPCFGSVFIFGSLVLFIAFFRNISQRENAKKELNN